MAAREEFDRADARAAKRRAATPSAISARYDRDDGRVVVSLSSGIDVSFTPRDAQGLEHAKPEQLASIEISPSGFGLRFPEIDADLCLPALLEGVFGSTRWMAARLGARGGLARTKAKAAASRENGKLGGRPPKKKMPRSKRLAGKFPTRKKAARRQSSVRQRAIRRKRA